MEVKNLPFQVDVIGVMKLSVLGEVNKSFSYLMYYNIVINTPVFAIAKVKRVFVFNLNNPEKLNWLIYLFTFTVIAEGC